MDDFAVAAFTHTEWDDFFVHNPAARHRRRMIHGLIRRHGLRFRNVLDVGCGDGRLLEELARIYGCEITGIERGDSSAPLRLGERLSGFHKIDIEDACLPGAFDLVVCTEVIEHLRSPDRAAAHLARMCGGHLLVTVPGGSIRETDRYVGHLRHYTVKELRALLEAAGFRTLECFAWGFPFHSLYKWSLDLSPHAIMRGYGKGRYGWKQKVVCRMLHALFFLNAFRSGEQIFYLGTPGRPLV